MPLRTKESWFGVVLDAPDADELAHFYQRLLGWTTFNESDEWVDLAPSEDAGYNLAFATERNYARPVWPTGNVSPRCRCTSTSRSTTSNRPSRVPSRWGPRADYQPQETVRVMLDPAGHPFFLYTA